MANKQPIKAQPKKIAKKIPTKSTPKENYRFPSHFGSHASMVDEAVTATLKTPGAVACRDEYGLYLTERSHLDSGLADPYRYLGGRMFEMKEKESQLP